VTMKSLAIRLSLFSVALAALQFLTAIAFPAGIPPEIVRLDAYLDSRTNIIYLGDSTLSLPAGQVTTGEILQEMLPDCSVGEIAHPAYNLDLYLHYVRYIVRSAHPPDIVIVPINMRSFSPEWDKRPGYQFEEEKKALAFGPFLSRALWRPLEVSGAFEQDDAGSAACAAEPERLSAGRSGRGQATLTGRFRTVGKSGGALSSLQS